MSFSSFSTLYSLRVVSKRFKLVASQVLNARTLKSFPLEINFSPERLDQAENQQDAAVSVNLGMIVSRTVRLGFHWSGHALNKEGFVEHLIQQGLSLSTTYDKGGVPQHAMPALVSSRETMDLRRHVLSHFEGFRGSLEKEGRKWSFRMDWSDFNSYTESTSESWFLTWSVLFALTKVANEANDCSLQRGLKHVFILNRGKLKLVSSVDATCYMTNCANNKSLIPDAKFRIFAIILLMSDNRKIVVSQYTSMIKSRPVPPSPPQTPKKTSEQQQQQPKDEIVPPSNNSSAVSIHDDSPTTDGTTSAMISCLDDNSNSNSPSSVVSVTPHSGDDLVILASSSNMKLEKKKLEEYKILVDEKRHRLQKLREKRNGGCTREKDNNNNQDDDDDKNQIQQFLHLPTRRNHSL